MGHVVETTGDVAAVSPLGSLVGIAKGGKLVGIALVSGKEIKVITNTAEDVKKITRSDHAVLRTSQGRNVHMAINDLNKAKPADVYMQEDGRYIIKGAGNRVHVLEPDGEIVTTMNNVTNFKKRVARNQYMPLTESQKVEFAKNFGEYLNSSWSSYK